MCSGVIMSIRFVSAPLFLGIAALAGITVTLAQSAVSQVTGVTIEQVGSSTMRTGEVPVYNESTGKFQRSSGPGAVMKWRPIGGDPSSADFNFTHSSTPFALGRPPDEVMMWGYNLNAGGGSEKAGETALGWSLEGHYEPAPGTEYTEAHLHYVTKAGMQQRPFTLRINKNDSRDVTLGLNGQVRFHSGDGSTETMRISPDGMNMTFQNAGGKGVQFGDDGGTFQINRTGGRGALDLSQGFDYAMLPGALLHKSYFAVRSNSVYFNSGNGGVIFIDAQGALTYQSPTGKKTIIAPG
jgi:hypothetical protein